jgi:hypothetical protein
MKTTPTSHAASPNGPMYIKDFLATGAALRTEIKTANCPVRKKKVNLFLLFIVLKTNLKNKLTKSKKNLRPYAQFSLLSITERSISQFYNNNDKEVHKKPGSKRKNYP